MKPRTWKFVDFPSNATCYPKKHIDWPQLSRTVHVLNRFYWTDWLKASCIVSSRSTLHYITLLYTFERFWDFFRVYISSRGSIICHLVRPSGLPEGLTRWQLSSSSLLLCSNKNYLYAIQLNLRLNKLNVQSSLRHEKSPLPCMKCVKGFVKATFARIWWLLTRIKDHLWKRLCHPDQRR